MTSIHIINPASDFPSYHSAEVFAAVGRPGRVAVADLSITTLAAFVPRTWTIRLTDEGVEPLARHDVASDAAPIVAITGKVSQRTRMIELAQIYRRAGKTVMIGGSYASLNPEDVRPYADVLVTGEIEDIASGLFTDIACGQAQKRYHGERPDISSSPVPRWDLYPTHRAQLGAIQTSRGCPFNCEFCDVIQYLGRKQRHKSPQQVVSELEELSRNGLRHIFLADDNFTVHRRHASGVLDALREWNARAAQPAQFMTQASIDVARDEALLEACRTASLDAFYIGIETPNRDSLREAGKKQNLKADLIDGVEAIVGRGIAVHAGMIAGFDADRESIFDELEAFIEASPMPILAIGALVAPFATPLHARLQKEGRLIPDGGQSANNPLETNIIPRHMTRERLLDGLRDLCGTVFAPSAFERRIRRFLEVFGSRLPPRPTSGVNRVQLDDNDRAVLKWLSRQGRGEGAMIMRILQCATTRPDAAFHVTTFLARYAQTRYMLAALPERRRQVALSSVAI